MITFACSACQKRLSVNDDLAGKRAKCPGCGQTVIIPAQVAIGDASTPGHAGLDRPPQVAPGNSVTHPPSDSPDATCGLDRPDAGHDLGLTAFLAPSQSGDELGRLGKYRILSILGHGGMVVVFEAEDSRLERKVAIKAMLPTLAASASAGQRFLREAQAMAAVKHDHIVRIYQVDEEGGVPFLAMEFLRGKTLYERLECDEKLPLGEVLRIGREIAEGLNAAHATGLIHRDVKPANVWLEAPRDRVKILDFGLARAASQVAGLTQQGAIVGTPWYMAPEQARGEAVDARCDLFSLGVVLYQACTGQRPFKGKDTISTLMAVVREEPAPPRQMNAAVPQGLSDLVMSLLEKDPNRRPASAGVVVEMLQALERKSARQGEDGDDTIPITPGPSPRPRAKAGRRRMPLLVALGLLALVPLGWWLATVILRVGTDKGTLIVQINDAETEARIKNGKLVLSGPDGKDRYTLGPGDRNKELAAGAYKVRVEGADGLTLDTPEFTIEKGGKVTVRVTAVANAIVKAANPDREAAEYVLAIGGSVRVNELDTALTVALDLPQGSFRLTGVTLSQTRVSDVGLALFKGCKSLTYLNLNNTKVGNAGLAHFKDCKNLTALYLADTNVGDEGLAHFKDCKNLTDLGLGNTNVGDEGLAHFKDCKNLIALGVNRTKVSDAGLTYFKDCKRLTTLYLGDTNIGDEGLAHFKDCKLVTVLSLHGTRVSDLSPLKGMKLTLLHCERTQVLDLSALKGMPLKLLQCDFKPERDAEILRSIKTLETINGKPVKEFWREVDAKK